MSLKGRTAVVTGASRGIGEAVARQLAAQGVRLWLVSRTPVPALAEELGAGFSACDVSKEEDVERMARAAVEGMGPPDILINNAGVAGSAPLHKLTLGEWERIMGINATGTFLCCRALVPAMVQRGWGRVVNVASVAATTGGRYITAYSASKHAVLGFTRSLALDVALRGVTVNAVCPGYVDTPMTEQTVENVVRATGRSAEEARAALHRTSPQNRLFDVEEVAHAVLFLCQDLSRGINGQALVIDGGGVLG